MSKIYVIGIDGSGTLKQRRDILERCGLIIASRRLASLLGNTFVPIHPITPIEEACEQIEKGLEGGNVCVLASGDPLFYGIAGRLFERFGRDRIDIYPALSSLQEAFAKFKLSWDDVHIVSLHGRRTPHIPGLLLSHKKTFSLTDAQHSPDKIAEDIMKYLTLIGADELREKIVMYVAENLGANEEKITCGALADIAEKEFSSLNVLCIILPHTPLSLPFGLREDEITHSRGLITKDEVRAVTLHRLKLPKKGTFWDIGGGSGSISIEAATQNPQLTIYTVEHREEEISNIKANIRKFGLFNVIPVAGRAAQVLSTLPTPNSVFIGGSDGEMGQIVKEAASRLAQGGRLVANGVTEKTISVTPKLMEKHGLAVTSSTIEVTRTGPDGPASFNPITIMVGTK